MIPKILVVSNDAGATEYLAHLISSEYTKASWKTCALEGSPAFKIFTKFDLDCIAMKSVEDLHTVVKNIRPDIIIYGTGWQENFSKIVSTISNKLKIKSIALLDHWTKYMERFEKESIPKNIIVMDDRAYDLAKNIFDSSVNIIQLKNYYIENIRYSYDLIKEKSSNRVLFISEPTAKIAQLNFGSEDAFGFTEYSVVRDLLSVCDSLIIRLHPSDDKTKYNNLVEKYVNKEITIIESSDEDLVETLSKSKLTIGFDGMALFISYLLGIDTLSYMPNTNRKLHIPIPQTYLIDNLLDLKKINFDDKRRINLDENSIEFTEMLEDILR